MNLAVIDCGTNTFNLLIIELHADKTYNRIFNTRIPVRLGDDAINEGFIAEVPFMRGVDAIGSFKQDIKNHQVGKVLAFATSAIRDARNGNDFVNEVRALHDIDITVIDGAREAELIYYGIRAAVKMDQAVSLIMDIGGGSNEFILASRDRIFWKESFKIGAARVHEKFRHSSPITPAEKNAICSYLAHELQPLMEACRRYPPAELIGSSGAFESIVEMICGELGGEPLVPEKTEYHVSLDKNREISELVFASNYSQRRSIRGLVPMRVDMIVISCLMVNYILDSLKLQTLRVSTYSLKEGALLDFIDKKN